MSTNQTPTGSSPTIATAGSSTTASRQGSESASASSSNSQNRTNNSGNNNRQQQQRGTKFRGAVTELHDFVFCTPREQPNLKPYSTVLNQLRLYIDTHYPIVCTYFRPCFANDGNKTEPSVPIPDLPDFDAGPEPAATDTAAKNKWIRLSA